MADRPAGTDTSEPPASVAKASGHVRAVGEASTSEMAFDLQNSVGEVKDAVAALSRAVEKGFGRLDALERSTDSLNRAVEKGFGRLDALERSADTRDRVVEKGFGRLDAVERSASDLKEVLRLLAPKVDDLAGFAKHRAPSLIDKSDLEVVQSRLFVEIQKRPTRRQAVFDIAWIVGLWSGLI